jgi:hypothetical protein
MNGGSQIHKINTGYTGRGARERMPGIVLEARWFYDLRWDREVMGTL